MSQAVGLESLNSSLPAEGMLQPDPHFILQEHELENSRIRSLWSANMTNKPEPTKYLKTAVLMLSWNDSDLDTEPEVMRLEQIFKSSYNFTVEKVRIDKSLAAVRMTNHLTTFILRPEHNSKDTLLIIYYAGHGWVKGGPEGELLLGAKSSVDELKQKDYLRNWVTWTEVEKNLVDVDSDVLAIFDCCHAGRLCRFRAPTHFEYIGACLAHETTPPPGDYSFTSALIWALEQLINEDGFPVSALLKKITEAPNFPRGQTPALAHRLYPSPDHIMIAPVKDSDHGKDRGSQSVGVPMEYLDLRFHFAAPLGDAVIIQTAKALNRLIAGKEIRADCISLVGKYLPVANPKLLDITNLVMAAEKSKKYARQWWSMTKHGERLNASETAAVDVVTPASITTRDASPSDIEQREVVDPTKDQPAASTSSAIAGSPSPAQADAIAETRKRKRPTAEVNGESSQTRQKSRKQER